MERKLNILIIYCYDQYPPRMTVWDHLYSFRRYTRHRCFYLNLALNQTPSFITKVKFDLIIFHTAFVSTRCAPEIFRRVVQRARSVKRLDAVKLVLPQDEYMYTNALCDFINELDIDYIFSVAPESEWPKIYHSVDFNKVKLFNVLTGYLDDETVAKINQLAKAVPKRDIDIGYRSWRAVAWVGRHGLLKTQIADLFNEKAPQQGLVTDISTHAKDTILGINWYKFLLRCKYTIGVEGGSSILDPDGMIGKRTESYLKLHPQASFEEIEQANFPGQDNSIFLVALSPRHLEACATRTCQVLVEGEYNGILRAGEHYVELKRDFSNIGEVLEVIKQDEQRKEIVDRAYRDIVESGRYTYRSFVNFIVRESMKYSEVRSPSTTQSLWTLFVYSMMRLTDARIRLALLFFRPLRSKLRLGTRLRQGLRIFSSKGKPNSKASEVS